MTEMGKDLVALHYHAKAIRKRLLRMNRLANKIINGGAWVRQPEFEAAIKARDVVRAYYMSLLEVELALLDGEMVGHYLRED